MSETPVTAHRPALLVGYGAFGLDALRRLLASTAPRGVLRWQQPASGASAGDRYLRDLALLWVPDRWEIEGQQVDDEDRREGAEVEMMRDLYRQIQRLEEHSTPEADLAAAMEAAAEQLLSASDRAAHDQVSPLGLDVVLLARPTSPEVIGILDRMVAAGMERLANNPNLLRAVQGAEALSFVEILDFENYWDGSQDGRRLREAVTSSVERWQHQRRQRRPAFGRFYFVDGRTHDGFRDVRYRLDEITLFLEFLLFEGQRGTLQNLYQSPGTHESPVATFGIRMMERSAGLLSRLAAARFGIGWLDHLARGDEASQDGAAAAELQSRLEPYRPTNLDELVKRPELESLLDAEVNALRGELLTLEPDDPEWIDQVEGSYLERADQIRDRLAESASHRMTEINREQLAELEADLRASIDRDLHDSRQPASLATVIKTVDKALGELATDANPSGTHETRAEGTGTHTIDATAADSDPLKRLQRLHARFRTFQNQRIDVEGLKKWWLLFALVLAAAVAPIGAELLEEIPKPDDTRYFLNLGWNAIQRIKSQAAVGGLAFLAIWMLGRLAAHRRVASRVDRARRFFKDPERGRFAHRLSRDLEPGGALRAPLESFLDALIHNLALSLRTEVSRELGRLRGRLHDRQREMLWLREQLREFLRIQGLSVDRDRHQLHRSESGTGIRHPVERDADFEQMLKSNPPNPARYRSLQTDIDLFDAWDERYGQGFLYPLAFVDRLSAIYRDPFQRELARAGSGPEQEIRARDLLGFLRRHGTFDLAFRWAPQEGVPTDRRTCLLPAVWRHLPGVLDQLSDLRMSEENVLIGNDVARAYLLRIQTGVEPSCLLEAK